jgi:[ribosomal protein S18]-alanine N-acetyltransferase
LRDMERSDLESVTRIEADCYETPWTLEMFTDELRERSSWHRVAASLDEKVVGYLIGRCYPDLWHLMNLAVPFALRRTGIGGTLLSEFLEAADAVSMGVLLEARPSNEDAISLYLRRGFAVMGLRRGYYTDNNEDALVMTRGSHSGRR